MNSPSRTVLALALPLLLLASCPNFPGLGTDILHYDNQLEELYVQEEQAETDKRNGSESEKAQAEETLAGLGPQYLAIMADAAGEAEQATRTKTQVSLYRIAATAGWRGGSDQVVDHSRKGREVCDADTSLSGSRDCSMLAAFPDLAGNDAAVRELEAYRDEKPPNAVAERLTKTFLARLEGVREARREVSDYELLHDAFETQVHYITCNAWIAYSLARDAPDGFSVAANKDRLNALRTEVEETTGQSATYIETCPRRS